jgi:hypothetical protein
LSVGGQVWGRAEDVGPTDGRSVSSLQSRPRRDDRADDADAVHAYLTLEEPSATRPSDGQRASDLLMTSLWIWLVPSKICMTFVSRM